MTDLRGIWCVIPVYNNAATVFDIAARARRILPNVLVVDDGSTDRNLAECFSGSGIPVLRPERNLGQAAAILTALNHLSADPSVRYMITLDADGQHDPEDIPRFYPLMARNDYSLLIGCRDFSGLQPVRTEVCELLDADRNRSEGRGLPERLPGVSGALRLPSALSDAAIQF